MIIYFKDFNSVESFILKSTSKVGRLRQGWCRNWSLTALEEMRQAVRRRSTPRIPAVAFGTSATARNPEKSPLSKAVNASSVLYPTLNSVPLNVVAVRGTTLENLE